MEEMQEADNLIREQKLIVDTILSLNKIGWEQYVDCSNFSIKLIKDNTKFIIKVDTQGNIHFELNKEATDNDFTESKEVFEIFSKLTDEINLFDYFDDYADSHIMFLILKRFFVSEGYKF